MKTVIFTEEKLYDLDEIGIDVFIDEQDPRSSAYIRKLKRPPISWIKVILYLLIPSFVLAAFVASLIYCGLPTMVSAAVAAVALLVYILLTLKQAVIYMIKIYQRYAPDSLRNKCRFEPSCSEYMIHAIEKYGLIKGLPKGIRRLKRCNIDGGGFDFP